MAFTDKQKTKRFELENKQGGLTPAERLLLAALNDLKEADETGRNIEACEKAVKQAEKALENESENEGRVLPEAITAGGDDVRRVQENQGSKEKTVEETEVEDKKKKK